MLRMRRAAQPPGAHDAAQVAFDERDAGALHRDVGAGAHGDADIGRGQRGRIVDAVAGHRHAAALAACSALDLRLLLLGQDFRHHFVDAELAERRLRACVRLSPVSMTIRMPSRWSAAIASAAVVLDRVGDAEDARELAVDRDEHHALAVRPTLVGFRF